MGEELLGNMRFEQKDKTGCFFILDIDSYEFVALIHHPMSRAEIEKLLNQLREELKELKAGAVTCSIGVIPVEKQYTVEELYRSADRVLYEAKKRGKDQFVFGYHFPAKTSGRLSVFQGGGQKKASRKKLDVRRRKEYCKRRPVSGRARANEKNNRSIKGI